MKSHHWLVFKTFKGSVILPEGRITLSIWERPLWKLDHEQSRILLPSYSGRWTWWHVGKAVTVKCFRAGGVGQLPGKAEANPGRTLCISKLRNNRELFYTGSTIFFFLPEKITSLKGICWMKQCISPLWWWAWIRHYHKRRMNLDIPHAWFGLVPYLCSCHGWSLTPIRYEASCLHCGSR